MKIYTNENYEIKAINQSEDKSLTEIEMDRAEIFGDKSDFMILNYCYKPSDGGYSVYPAMDYSILKLLDTQIMSKLSILEEENANLKEELSLTQNALNEVLSIKMEV